MFMHRATHRTCLSQLQVRFWSRHCFHAAVCSSAVRLGTGGGGGVLTAGIHSAAAQLDQPQPAGAAAHGQGQRQPRACLPLIGSMACHGTHLICS